ncbi:MAG: phosphotransferase family protein [Rubrobacteraceae bacterium]|jgi:thiamine kinase-like enzyme
MLEKPRPYDIQSYLENRGMTFRDVSFLAQGEYSLNYLARGDEDVVVRLVTGSQIGLSLQEQAPYEHNALELLSNSGVTPKPYFVDPSPEKLPYPVVVEEFLPGEPLDYATDIKPAARCVAAIHALGVPADHGLQLHPDPAPAILAESRGLAAPYLEWTDATQESKSGLRKGFARIEGSLEQKALFTGDALAIVNYDLNTHNFVVDHGQARLLDWEKARIAPLTQDLAHFLLPTTTLWRDASATLLSKEQEQTFIDAYLENNPVPDVEIFHTQLAAMRTIVSLRAVSWCAWALQETARSTRPITNEETLNKSRQYLEPEFLERLFEV